MSEAHSIDALSDEAFGWYLTGLTDGEGCFKVAIHNGRRAFPRVCPSFNIAMRDDEAPNLEAVFRRTGCGYMYREKPSRPNSRGYISNPIITWRVFRTSELAGIIVPHFDRFPLQFKKARDFATWREIVLLRDQISKRTPTNHSNQPRDVAGGWFQKGGRIATNEEMRRMVLLREQLMEARKYKK